MSYLLFLPFTVLIILLTFQYIMTSRVTPSEEETENPLGFKTGCSYGAAAEKRIRVISNG